MERYYVTSREISGMMKRDRRIAMEQCVERGSFAILDPAQFIATRLFQFLEDYIDTRYTRRWILGKLREGGFFNLTVNNPGVGIRVERVVLGADLEKGVYFGDIRGNASIRRVYEVDVIDDKTLAYLACEYIVHPFDGVPFVERTYTPLFTQLARANRYVQSESKNYECAYGDGDSGWHVIPVDADAIQQSTWYQANLKAASDIKQYHLNREDFRYIQDVEELRKRIQESAYDDLVSSEKDGINYTIYMAVRAYLPDDIREDLDMALDEFGDGSDGDVEGVADQAIRAAYAYAADKDAFDVLTEVLAPWRFRVEGANDYVYNAHPDTGWLLAARNGGIGWYEEAFFANEWEGNRDNPWFGKFIPNACEPLPFVMEFDPNCFVDRLPTQAELDMLRGRYMETVRDRRAEHGEMVFEDCEDDMGENVPCCVGDWYPDGLDVDEETKYKGVFFRVQYGNHTFTEDECRKLLSGEEVSIDGFMTKSKMTVSIRGKLMNRTGQFSKYLDIQYVRTDVHGNTRRAYARKLGLSIDEGLPDDPAAFNGGI